MKYHSKSINLCWNQLVLRITQAIWRYSLKFGNFYLANKCLSNIWVLADRCGSLDPSVQKSLEEKLKECKTVKSDINELWLRINTFVHWLSRQKRQHKFIGRQCWWYLLSDLVISLREEKFRQTKKSLSRGPENTLSTCHLAAIEAVIIQNG